MPDSSVSMRLAPALSAVAIAVGAACGLAGASLSMWALTASAGGAGLSALLTQPQVALGVLLAGMGFSLVLRGVHMRISLDGFGRGHLAHPTASAQTAPPSATRWEPRRVDPTDAPQPAEVHLAKPRVPAQPAAQARVVQVLTDPLTGGAPGAAAHRPPTAQPSPARASRDTPLKGKPFQPHPIFMARPPK